MVKLGSIILIILLLVGIWLMLSATGLFNKVGKTAIRSTDKLKKKSMEEYKDGK